MIRSFFILLFSALLLLGGCGGDSPKGSRVAGPTVTKERAIEAAKDAARERGSFDEAAQYSAKPASDGWQVTIRDSSGKTSLVMVDGEGAVIIFGP